MTTALARPSLSDLVACHECDLLHERVDLQHRAAAKCSRCGATLYRQPRDSVNRALMLSITAAILFAIANVYPFMYFKIQGRVEVNTMMTGVIEVWGRGYQPLAALIFLASILAPGLKIACLLFVLVPLKLGWAAPGSVRVFRFLTTIGPWGMLEVYMFGVLVGIVNLVSLATIIMGTAFYAFVALFFISTAAGAAIDPHLIWGKLEERRR